MEILFLGTGAAWSVPEHSCRCAICQEMSRRGEERKRTSFLVKGIETILMDCGPDIRAQMRQHDLGRPDGVLITHEHADHFLGLDDLLAFRRSVSPKVWQPIPVYATAQTWQSIEPRFGYLIGTLIEKRIVVPKVPLEGLKTAIIPFKTFHGPSAAGSVGYFLEQSTGNRPCKVVYTSDFSRLDEEPDFLSEPDVLITQSHWLNEPAENRPNQLSFQRAIDYIKRWKPRRATYLVHISSGDRVPDDPHNDALKKRAPLSPICEPATGSPYPIPKCQSEWQGVVDRISRDFGIPGPVIVAEDGLSASF